MDNNFIKTYDNLLPKSLENAIETISLSPEIPWSFKKDISGTKVKIPSYPLYGFGYTFYDDYYNIQDPNMFFFFQPLYRALSEANIILEKMFQGRLFLQTPNPNPRTVPEAIHNDLDQPHLTCIYYINDAIGDTVFFNNNLQEIKKVSPKKGRIILFNGNIKHTGSTPPTIRSMINYNFSGQILND